MTASLLSTASINYVYYYGLPISKTAYIPVFQTGFHIPISLIPINTTAEKSNHSGVQDILQQIKSVINKGGKNKVSQQTTSIQEFREEHGYRKLIQLTKNY